MANSSAVDILTQLDDSVWMNSLRVLIALNNIGTNLFLVALFVRYKELRKENCNKLILLNTAMDTICGAFCKRKNTKILKKLGFGPLFRAIFQFYLLCVKMDQFSKMICIFVGFPYRFGYASSQITFIGLAIDRFMAILRPMSFRESKQVETEFYCLINSF